MHYIKFKEITIFIKCISNSAICSDDQAINKLSKIYTCANVSPVLYPLLCESGIVCLDKIFSPFLLDEKHEHTL